ncbi:MAG: hypothetical protein II528_06635 [Lachnospiraceae bacterium]|jgi:hypothetical protein|nr:hypothetical protein [Lachnospiraceae bacterium]MBQ2503983.1 hypothetical protein [Lachnospiraceae bacterium]MBQ2533630.1 hypothetical protein [Lachnospiraceae bacterium]
MSNYFVTYNQSLRNLYTDNRMYATRNGRDNAAPLALAKADSNAVGKGILALGKFNYGSDTKEATESEKKSLSGKLKAFVDSYNLSIDSVKASKDKTATKVSKKMQKLVEDYKDELSAYGISVKSGGYMELSASAVENLSFKTFEKKFGKDSDFMKELSKFEKQLSRHFDAYA